MLFTSEASLCLCCRLVDCHCGSFVFVVLVVCTLLVVLLFGYYFVVLLVGTSVDLLLFVCFRWLVVWVLWFLVCGVVFGLCLVFILIRLFGLVWSWLVIYRFWFSVCGCLLLGVLFVFVDIVCCFDATCGRCFLNFVLGCVVWCSVVFIVWL